jgi:hypothetical protein
VSKALRARSRHVDGPGLEPSRSFELSDVAKMVLGLSSENAQSGVFVPFERDTKRPESARGLEDQAVFGVQHVLGLQGHDAGEVRRPDRDSTIEPQRRRRPDAVMSVDGVPTAVEVSIITTDPEQVRTLARLEALRDASLPLLRRFLPPAARLLIEFRFTPGDRRLLRLTGQKLDDAVKMLCAAVYRELRLGLPLTRGESVPLRSVPEGLIDAKATLFPSEDEHSWVQWFFGQLHQEGPDALATWVASVVSRKGSQHEEWGRGILVAVATGAERPEDVVQAFGEWARKGRTMPWWRVYMLTFAGDGIAQLWPPVFADPAP